MGSGKTSVHPLEVLEESQSPLLYKNKVSLRKSRYSFRVVCLNVDVLKCSQVLFMS